MKHFVFIGLITLAFLSCKNSTGELKYLGNFDIDVNGDTLFHKYYPFVFTDQEGELFTDDSIEGQVHVAFYFFTHCPNICPKVVSQVKRFRNAHPKVPILAYTCDPERDNVDRLKWYHTKHAPDDKNWHFLTGEEDDLNLHGVDSYMLANREDVMAPGGFLHSEKIVLVDRRGHIRGAFDGTNTSEVNSLIEATTKLLASNE